MRLKKKTHPVVRFAVFAVIILLVFGTVPAVAGALIAADAGLSFYAARRPPAPQVEP